MAGDYSQLELRILAFAAGEHRLVEAFKHGGDPHGAVADELARICGVPVDRQLGKRVNFAAVYGAGPKTIFEQLQRDSIKKTGHGLDITMEQVEEIFKAWWDMHPAIQRFMQVLHMEAVTSGQVSGLFGQCRHLPDAASQDRQRRGRALRQLGNFPIQNGGAAITLRAMAMIDNRLQVERLRSMVIGQVHDSVIVDTHPGELDKVLEVLKTEMGPLMEEWLDTQFELKISLDVDVKVGYDMHAGLAPAARKEA